MTNIFLILVLVGSLSFFSGCTQAPDKNSIKADLNATSETADNNIKQEVSSNAVPASTGIMVSYRLDPWLIDGTYSGERWVSPSVFGPVTQGRSTFTVEARARGIDVKGKLMDIILEWTPDNPDMVAVVPIQGNEVNITVKRAGESSLQVISREVSKTLSIKATYQENAIRVVISQ